MKKIILSLVFIFNVSFSFAADPLPTNQGLAYLTWLKRNSSFEINSNFYQETRFYSNLVDISVHLILKNAQSKWNVGHVKAYSMGVEVPVRYSQLQISREGEIDTLAQGAVYYIANKNLGDDSSDGRLIIETSGGSLTIYYNDKSFPEFLTFFAELKRYESELNIYRNASLQINKGNQIAYLENVDQYKFGWNDLILNEELKQLTKHLTEDFVGRFDSYKKIGVKNVKQGVLLAGPPGTGKSFLGQILVSAIQGGNLDNRGTLFVITARQLKSVSNINMLFTQANKLAPSIVFMEDVDLFGVKNRDNNEGMGWWSGNEYDGQSLLNELLNGIDGFRENEGLLIIGTTNNIKRMDPAMTRSERLGVHLYFGLPNFEERKMFFETYVKKHAILSAGVTVEMLASISEGFSGSDIFEIIRIAKKNAYVESRYSPEDENILLLTLDDFKEAIALLKEEHTTGYESDDDSKGFSPFSKGFNIFSNFFNKKEKVMNKKSGADYLESLIKLKEFEKKLE